MTEEVQRDSLASQLARARVELEQGRPEVVVSDLFGALEAFSNIEAATWSVLGEAYRRLGDQEAATHALTRSAGLYDPAHASDLSASDAADIARALNSVGRFGHASRLARTVLGTAGPDAGLLQALADASTQRGHVGEAVTARRQVAELFAGADRFTEACDELCAATDLTPDDADLLVDAARAAVEAGDRERAWTLVERAAALAPAEPRVLSTQAELDRGAGRPDVALDRLAQAGPLDGPDPWSAAVHARVLRDEGRAKEALGVLDGAELANPGDPTLLRARSQIRLLAGDHAGALDDARALVELRPSSARAHVQLGEALLATAPIDDTPIDGGPSALAAALESFSRAAELEPGLATAHGGRAAVLLAMDRADEAVAAYERALSIDPTEQEWLHSLGKALRLAGQREESLAVLDQALALGDDGEVLATKGEVLAELSSPDALPILEEAITQQPVASAFASMANLMIADDDLGGALETLDGALVWFPGDPELLDRRALVRNLLGLRDLALEDLDTLDRSNPPDARRLQMRAFILTQEDRFDEALEALGEASRLVTAGDGEATDALLMQVHLDRSAVLTLLERDDEAQREMDSAVDLAPEGEVRALLERGRLRYNTDDFDAADADFALALDRLVGDDDETVSSRAQALAWRGEVARMAGRIDDALAFLDGALVLDPGNAFALGTKGQLYVARGQLEEAEGLLLAALEGSPETWVHVELGELYRRQERFGEALERLDIALERTPDDAYARATRGQVQRALGRYDEAVEDLLTAIGTNPFPWAIEELLLVVSAQPDGPRLRHVLDQLDRRIAAGPVTGTVVVARAEVLRLLGRAADAMVAVDGYLAAEPEDLAAKAVRCALLVDLGRAAEAVELASTLLDVNADHTFVRQMKIRALADLDRHVEALGEVDLLADARHDSWARATRGGLLADVGRIQEAIQVLEPLVRDEKGNAFAAGALGYSYSKLGRWQEAADLLRVAADLDQDVAWYQQELGRALERLGRTAEAHEIYRRVLATVDQSAAADRNSLIVAGWCAFRLNQLTWAASLLGRTAPGDREMPEARLDLGLVLLASGRRLVALDEFEGAVDLLRKQAEPARARAMLVSALDDLVQARHEGLLDAHRDAAERAEAMLKSEISRYPPPE